jgi:hypothetical protein
VNEAWLYHLEGGIEELALFIEAVLLRFSALSPLALGITARIGSTPLASIGLERVVKSLMDFDLVVFLESNITLAKLFL